MNESRRLASRIWSVLVLLACVVATAVVTRWVVLAELRADCGGAVEFHRYRDTLTEFVAARTLADGEHLTGDSLPGPLRRAGVTGVYRNGRFVYFVLPHTSLLADDATREFAWQTDWDGGGVEDILRTIRRNTYHIQHLSSAPGWYYWMHN